MCGCWAAARRGRRPRAHVVAWGATRFVVFIQASSSSAAHVGHTHTWGLTGADLAHGARPVASHVCQQQVHARTRLHPCAGIKRAVALPALGHIHNNNNNYSRPTQTLAHSLLLQACCFPPFAGEPSPASPFVHPPSCGCCYSTRPTPSATTPGPQHLDATSRPPSRTHSLDSSGPRTSTLLSCGAIHLRPSPPKFCALHRTNNMASSLGSALAADSVLIMRVRGRVRGCMRGEGGSGWRLRAPLCVPPWPRVLGPPWPRPLD